jgi:hypothetical protein
MKLRNTLKFTMPFVSALLLASCSNDNQPVSVASNNGNMLTIAGISDIQVQDMGYVTNQLWAVTLNYPKGGGNYYLARFDILQNKWTVSTSRYGVKCAVAASGKCYHVNAAGELYWVTSINGNATKINTPKINTLSTTAKDVGAGSFGDNDWIWVVLMTSNGNKYICFGTYSGSGNSADWQPALPLVRGSPVRVATDPLNGNVGVFYSSYGDFYYHDPDGGRVGTARAFQDVAVCDNLKCVTIINSNLYVSTDVGNFQSTNIAAKLSVAATQINGQNAVLYIDSNYHLCIVAFDSLLPPN